MECSIAFQCRYFITALLIVSAAVKSQSAECETCKDANCSQIECPTLDEAQMFEYPAPSFSSAKRWLWAFLYTSIINLTSLSGILFKPFLLRPLFPWLLMWMIGLGVGSMFSVSVIQLIPEDRKIRRRFISDVHRIPTVVWLIVLCDGLHNFVDGLAISAALSSSYKDGLAIFLAILFEEIPCEIGDFAVFMKAGLSLRRALAFNFASSMTNYLGIGVGFMISDSSLIRSWIYGIAAGMFMYISLGVLLAELNDQEKNVAQNSSKMSDSVRGIPVSINGNCPCNPSKSRLVAILFVQNFGILSGCFIQILIMLLTD